MCSAIHTSPRAFSRGGSHLSKTERPDHSRRNDNLPFNQNSPARSAYSIFKLTGRAMVRPASRGLTNGQRP